MIATTYAVLFAAFCVFGARMLKGPSLSDRVIALDGLTVTGVGFLLVNAMDTGRGAFLQVAVMLALVGFISTAVIARFIEGRGE